MTEKRRERAGLVARLRHALVGPYRGVSAVAASLILAIGVGTAIQSPAALNWLGLVKQNPPLMVGQAPGDHGPGGNLTSPGDTGQTGPGQGSDTGTATVTGKVVAPNGAGQTGQGTEGTQGAGTQGTGTQGTTRTEDQSVVQGFGTTGVGPESSRGTDRAQDAQGTKDVQGTDDTQGTNGDKGTGGVVTADTGKTAPGGNVMLAAGTGTEPGSGTESGPGGDTGTAGSGAGAGTPPVGTTLTGDDKSMRDLLAALPSRVGKSASLQIEVRNVDEAVTKISGLAEKDGANGPGYVESSSTSVGQNGQKHANMTIKVPSASFLDTLAQIERLGTGKDKVITGREIVPDYTDAEARLKVLKQQESRYMEILAKVKTVDEIVRLENELAAVRVNIETLEGRIEALKDGVTYCTVSVDILQAAQASGAAPSGTTSLGQSAGAQAGQAFMLTTRGLGVLVVRLAGILGGAAPVLIVIALVWLAYFIYARTRPGRVRGRG